MTARRPVFSVVTAIYNVEPYLPAFIASIEAQAFDLERIEVIAVDDGSTDLSLQIVERWARSRPGLVKVFSQRNAGQGAARNLGLEHATGEWVTFTDPDDMLDPDFFDVASRFSEAHPEVQVMSGNPWLLEEAKGGPVTDTHPRRRQYAAGDRRVDLDQEPNTFTGSATVSLFRLEKVREFGLTFDPRIRPTFEDGHFAVCFLLGLPSPVVGILRDARYIYRKRETGDSSLQRALSDPRRYSDVFRYGYLDVLDRARARDGSVPAWLQHVLIYELSWYLSADERPSSGVRIAPEQVEPFHGLLGQVVRQLDPAVVAGHTVRRLRPVWADILAHAYRGEDWHSREAARTRVDEAMGLQRIAYRYIGRAPDEALTLDGRPTDPDFAKTMTHDYFDRTLLFERILWLPLAGAIRLSLDGAPLTVRDGWPEAPKPVRAAGPRPLRSRYRSLATADLARGLSRRVRRRLGGASRQAMVVLSRSRPYRSRFRHAWVLMDRVYTADDNAERLFEHLLAKRPDINAWFVIERGVPDWERLKAAGVPRVVEFGSFRWKLLMLNADWLVSSHADGVIIKPPAVTRIIGEPTWRFAFLQHGVTKDDLSRWLNGRGIDIFVVSTPAELESVAGDGTGYEYTRKEAQNTGLPRFDRLLAKGRAVRQEDRDLIIVAPTWRTYLTQPGDPASQRRTIDDAFWDSDYQRAWSAVLRSPAIAEAARRRGWRVGYMPHPNLQPVLAQMDLPAHVEPLTFTGEDVQGLYARCALLVTDYSSVAFNIAYLDGSVVYYQFDRDLVLGGAHIGRRGYFDYERDGFGPVATDDAGAIAAIVAAIERGSCPSEAYQERIDRTFVQRDGGACARVVAAIETASRPYQPTSSPAEP